MKINNLYFIYYKELWDRNNMKILTQHIRSSICRKPGTLVYYTLKNSYRTIIGSYNLKQINSENSNLKTDTNNDA